MYDYLRSICADVHVTKGDFDDQKGYPEDEVLSIGDFRIGLCHGHQIRTCAGFSLFCMLGPELLRQWSPARLNIKPDREQRSALLPYGGKLPPWMCCKRARSCAGGSLGRCPGASSAAEEAQRRHPRHGPHP